MKKLAYILSILVIVLTSSPCIDEPVHATIHSLESSHNMNSEQNHESHHCSPFCTCQCCATPVYFDSFSISFSRIEHAEKPQSNYSSFYTSALFTSIWQPPKIS